MAAEGLDVGLGWVNVAGCCQLAHGSAVIKAQHMLLMLAGSG